MSQKYEEIVRRLKKGKIYVPEKPMNSCDALAGALLNMIMEKEGIDPVLDVDYLTKADGIKVDEPRQRIGEDFKDFKKRWMAHDKKMDELREEYIVMGEEAKNGLTDLQSLYDIAESEGIIKPNQVFRDNFLERFVWDIGCNYDEMSEISKLINDVNLLRTEAKTQGKNYFQISNLMQDILESRLDNSGKNYNEIDPASILRPVEEDLARMNSQITVNIKFTDDRILFSVPTNNAKFSRINEINSSNFEVKGDMTTIATISIDGAEKLGLYDSLLDDIEAEKDRVGDSTPVVDMGGQEVYNSNGDNLTMTIHQIADAMVKCMVSESFDNKREITSQGKTFSVMQLNDKVGGFYEDAAKIAEGSNVIGIMSPGQNDNVVFKPIPNEMAHFENLPGKDGLSITFERGYTEGEYGQSIAIPASEVCINAIESGELELIIDELGIDEYNHNIDELYTEDEEQEIEDDELEIE